MKKQLHILIGYDSASPFRSESNVPQKQAGSHVGITLKRNSTTTGQALVGKDLLRVARRQIAHSVTHITYEGRHGTSIYSQS